MDENSNKNTPLLIRFIDKTDPFFSTFWILWALEMVCMSIFVDYDRFCIPIPFFVVVICGIIIAILAFLIRQNFIKDRTDSKGRALFIIWNAVGPLIYNLLLFPFIESKLYNYSGEMLGGITQFFVRGFNIILAILFLIVWFAVNAVDERVSDKMWKKGIKSNPNISKNVNRVLGIITLIVLIYLLIFVGGKELAENISYNVKAKKDSVNSQFKDEMDGHLNKIDSAKSEVISTVKLVEIISSGKSIEDNKKETHLVTTTLNQDVLDKGAAELILFTAENKLTKDFSSQEGAMYSQFYADDRTAHFAIPSIYMNEEGKSKECEIVCKYNDKWELHDIYILTEPLTEKTRK